MKTKTPFEKILFIFLKLDFSCFFFVFSTLVFTYFKCLYYSHSSIQHQKLVPGHAIKQLSTTVVPNRGAAAP